MRSLIIDGMDTFADWGLVLSSKELNPPAPKFYTVDIPGGNGQINLTQALSGDTAYENRQQEFVFTMYYQGVSFEALKTVVSNFLHGREFDYKLSWDPEYTYHGWFSVDKYGTDGALNQITITVDADPYKFKKNVTQAYNTSKGITLYPISGRKTVQPRLEFTTDSVVIFGNKRYEMPKGTYKLEDLWFTQGQNELFIASAGLESLMTHREMSEHTYGEIASSKPIYMWYEGTRKHYVKTIKLTPNGEEITGVITFTATDSEGSTFTASVDIGTFSMRTFEGVSDTLEIEDGTARFIRRIFDETDPETGTTATEVSVVPTVFTFEFPGLFSNAGEIVSVTSDSTGVVEFSTDSINVEKVYYYVVNGDYAEGGTYAMTHAEMAKYRNSQLGKIIIGENTTSYEDEDENEMVYLDYEWSDL